jgi:N-acetyl-gamma-glutamyl-phosphate reductase
MRDRSVFEDIAPREAARGCDVALLALPHKVTAAKVPELVELGVKIVDMSGDFGCDAATYEFGAAPH